MTETMRTTIRICDKYGIGEACPICGVPPGIYLDGKPFCLSCVSQYPHANVLGEGPNKSKRPARFWPFVRRVGAQTAMITAFILVGAVLIYWWAILAVCLIVASIGCFIVGIFESTEKRP